MNTRFGKGVCMALAMIILAGGAHAQEPAAAAPAARQEPAPYMRPLGRLAGILGSIHYLRTLCGADDANSWRDSMNEILATQHPSDAERRVLTAQFNGGYRAFESTYRDCTPSAELAVRRYLDEGESLAADIASRYGN